VETAVVEGSESEEHSATVWTSMRGGGDEAVLDGADRRERGPECAAWCAGGVGETAADGAVFKLRACVRVRVSPHPD
jgi:hypothetical protein